MTDFDEINRFIAEWQQDRDEHALLAAFSAAKGAMARTARTDHAYPAAVATLAEVMFVYFEAFGSFAVVDCAVEMRRRRATLAPPYAAGFDVWRLSHPTWDGGTFSRSISDSAWTLNHSDGRRSEVSKDWATWTGEDWPMGWSVRRPDGVVIQLDEDQWGDGWCLDDGAPPAASADEIEGVTGFASQGKTRYEFTATSAGLRCVPVDRGEPLLVKPGEASIVRVMPVGDGQAFAMFGSGLDADDVFLTLTFWGSDAVQKASEVGFLVGARVLLAQD